MSPAPTLGDLRTDIARFQVRLDQLSEDLAETRADVRAHSRLVWGLCGILGAIELLNMLLPNGLRGLV